MGTQAEAQIIDDLVVQYLAPARPALRADQLFDAATQAVEAKDARGLAELRAHFFAETLKENQLKSFFDSRRFA